MKQSQHSQHLPSRLIIFYRHDLKKPLKITIVASNIINAKTLQQTTQYLKCLKYNTNHQNVTQKFEMSTCYWKTDFKSLSPCRVATINQWLDSTVSGSYNIAMHNEMKYTFTSLARQWFISVLCFSHIVLCSVSIILGLRTLTRWRWKLSVPKMYRNYKISISLRFKFV